MLVKLGFWQLARAEQKQTIAADLAERQQTGPLDFQQLLTKSHQHSLTGFTAKILVTPSSKGTILLDNQTFKGKVGYLAYQLVQPTASNYLLMMELGFVAAGKDRQQLPTVATLAAPQVIQGRVYQKSINPLSSQLLAENGWPMRIQNLNLPQLSEHLGQPIAPFVVQATNIEGNELPQPWQPIPMAAKKHIGYAVQWFSLAAALIVLSGYLLISKTNSRKPSEDIAKQQMSE
ncbi:SURF1 family protein [Shewanella waksmanii]|uniref:SURF1 family protein n=1 Tax=Shewanella waksmanii TaxID=213783 RepID=UPI003736EF94